jgi:transcriptional regulator GlxA family with amidase domain
MRHVGALIFPKFELLDLFGPLQMLGMLPEEFRLSLVSAHGRLVSSNQGPTAQADRAIGEDGDYDILLIPGGMGTRTEVGNARLIAWLGETTGHCEIVASVCTGAALLARAGMLDGRRATTNKFAFDWVVSQGPNVHWQRRARWVEDGKYFTSSGVSAGIDMSLALIARLHGRSVARDVASWSEYRWNEDPDDDPFAL